MIAQSPTQFDRIETMLKRILTVMEKFERDAAEAKRNGEIFAAECAPLLKLMHDHNGELDN